MEIKKSYIPLNDLEVYKLARELSKKGWEIYKQMDWHIRKINGDQFITSLDSIGANIAEGYGRYHYLDQIKFYYNARGSLFESCNHWLEILKERDLISEGSFDEMKTISEKLRMKLNNFITTTYRQKKKQ